MTPIVTKFWGIDFYWRYCIFPSYPFDESHMSRNRDDRLFTTTETILGIGILLAGIGLIGLAVLALLGAFPA